MTSVLLPVLIATVPVLGIALLAIAGRRLSGSCGGVGADGACQRCGKAAVPSTANGGACR